MKAFKLTTILTLLLLFVLPLPCKAIESTEREEIKKAVETIYQLRNEVFINGKVSELPKYYNKVSRYGGWALDHEVRRVKYLKKWADERGIKFTSVTSDLEFRKINPYKNGAKVSLNEYYKFEYVYKDDEESVINTFGVGLIHGVDLIKKDGLWIINWDWYTDCFEDALKDINSAAEDIKECFPEIYPIPSIKRAALMDLENTSENTKRKKAVDYGDKYCGIVWASNNPAKYNKKYKNYTGAGGNCTNFVSQCLGDKEGAGLKQQGGWHCNYPKYGQAEGSSAWVNADAFKNYLFYSGKGRLLKKAAFKDLVPKTENMESIFSKLNYGDVICYAKGSDIDHFAIVTSFDSRGYPLINSHTTDRYHVPFDLGWGNKNISFYLIKIRY
ncbi:amidase domain-containing protein [Clostridium polynesiense]|uniref:amidase domain-containing protein n=1 Tax=Clostridium polynesiense TaxID=1325933 RepID=UPI00058AE34C|nr:amidase domain-containing protein [Clostridium polynesiense]